MPSLVPPVPSNNRQLECNEGKLGGIEVTWHIMGYHGETRDCRAGECGAWKCSGSKLDFVRRSLSSRRPTNFFKAALNSTAAWGVQ